MPENKRGDVPETRSLTTDIAIGVGPALGAATAWWLNKPKDPPPPQQQQPKDDS